MRAEPSGPNSLLLSHESELTGGRAIDLACGLGQNTRWLAAHGYHALGLDISFIALRRAKALTGDTGLARKLLFVQCDLDNWSLPPDSVDLICVFRFLDRALFPVIHKGLRSGGLLFYETRHQGILQSQPQANPDYLLAQGELLQRFDGWHIVHHREGPENAALVARKPT